MPFKGYKEVVHLPAVLPAETRKIQSFRHDRYVHQNGIQPIKLSELLTFIFHNRLNNFPSTVKRERSSTVWPGWVHLGRDKEDLQHQRHTTFVRTYSTFLSYVEKGYEYMTFGTFHVKTRKPHERQRSKLNSVHAFVLDIDSKQWSVDDILQYCSEKDMVPPSFINETPRGYHVWFVLEHDIVGKHAETDKSLTKAGLFYDDMNRFLVKLFAERFQAERGGVDPLYGGERYIRIPQNIVYFSGQKYPISYFAQLKRKIYPNSSVSYKQKRSSNTYIPYAALRKDPAYKKLLTMQPVVGDRRRTAFSIALLFYSLHMDREAAEQFLISWYENLQNKSGFTLKEVLRSVQSAYSGDYQGVQSSWIQKLTGIKPKVFFTQKKAEHERIYKSLDHWMSVFLKALSDKGGVWEISNRQLCDALGMSSRNMLDKLIDHLLELNVIKKEVKGKGRGATTVYMIVEDPTPDDRPTNKVVSLDQYRQSKLSGQRSQTRIFLSIKMTHFRIEIISIIGMVGGCIFDLDDWINIVGFT